MKYIRRCAVFALPFVFWGLLLVASAASGYGPWLVVLFFALLPVWAWLVGRLEGAEGPISGEWTARAGDEARREDQP